MTARLEIAKAIHADAVRDNGDRVDWDNLPWWSQSRYLALADVVANKVIETVLSEEGLKRGYRELWTTRHYPVDENDCELESPDDPRFVAYEMSTYTDIAKAFRAALEVIT
jgi:hypothetical protein